jgi:hypothetical protein
MRGAICLPSSNMSSWRGAKLSTGTTLLLPFTDLLKYRIRTAPTVMCRIDFKHTKGRYLHKNSRSRRMFPPLTRVYPKVSGLADWSENCKCYSSLPLGAVVSLFCESG